METKQHQQTQKIILKLKKLNNISPVLSIYLSAEEKKSPNIHTLITEFHSLLKKKISLEDKKRFASDIARIENHLIDSFDTRGKKSVAFFSSGKNLFEVLSFEFSLPLLYFVSNSAYLAPILKALEKHKKYLILLVDREKARFFKVHLGEIEEHKDVFDESVPQTVRQINKAWAREDKILRHIDDHLNRHLKLIIKAVQKFIENENINFIILGGHKSLFSKVKKHLPKNLADKVTGAFISELNIPLNDIFLKSKKSISKL